MSKVKQQDEEVVEIRVEKTSPHRDGSKSPESSGEISEGSRDSETMIGPDIGLQFMKQREDWEKQEELNKERTSLHYQDILFDGELFCVL